MSQASSLLVDIPPAVETISIPSDKVPLPELEEVFVPKWLTKDYMEACLRRHYEDPALEVESIKVKPGSAKGDNYASYMLRVFVTFRSVKEGCTTRSYVVKTVIWDELTSRTLKKYNTHEKEMEAYEKVLPELKRILEGVEEKADYFPKAVLVDRQNEAMVFDDLLLKNYVMKDRLKGLDMEHVLVVLERMAKVHAAAAILHENNPKAFDKFPTGMFTRTTNAFYSFFESQWEAVTNEISSWFGYERYAQKMQALKDTFIENACQVYDTDDKDDFYTWAHGDFWTNNVMFRYNDKDQLEDVVILDFQYVSYGTPMIDFILFIYTSTNDEIRTKHVDELLQFYHKHLAEALKKMGYKKKIPTLLEFRLQYQTKSFLKITSTFLMYPVQTNVQGEDADLESLMSTNERAREFKKAICKKKEFQQTVKKLLPVFDREGILDPLH